MTVQQLEANMSYGEYVLWLAHLELQAWEREQAQKRASWR